MTHTTRTTAIYLQPFGSANFNRTLPAGACALGTVLPVPVAGGDAGSIITTGAHAGMSPRPGSSRPGIGE